MKKIFFAFVTLSMLASCVKHDPFDNLKGDVWILSLFAPENHSDQSGPNNSRRYYFSYDEMKTEGLFDTPLKDASGNNYRVPTSGELQMIFPKSTDDSELGQYNLVYPLCFSWVPTQDKLLKIKESAPLNNLSDNTADLSGDKVEGESEYYYYEDFEDDDPDFLPIFALRFKGTSQYAAYRYQILSVAQDNDYKMIINLKAKWLKEKDVTTRIEDIIKPDYWRSGYLELNIPADSYVDSQGSVTDYYDCRLLSSTLGSNGVPVVGVFNGSQSGLGTDYEGMSYKYLIRLIKCKSDGKLQ